MEPDTSLATLAFHGLVADPTEQALLDSLPEHPLPPEADWTPADWEALDDEAEARAIWESEREAVERGWL